MQRPTIRLTRAGRNLLIGAATILALALVAGGVALVRSGPWSPECTVRAGRRTVELSTEEAQYATAAVAHVLRDGGGLRGARSVVARPWRSAEDARAIAKALAGSPAATFTCDHGGGYDDASDALRPSGLTARADRVRRELGHTFGPLALGGFAPGGVHDGHMPGSAHYEGRAVDVLFRPMNRANRTRGWALARYLVAHAERLEIETVIFDKQIWTASRSDEGWRTYRVDTRNKPAAVARILQHRDHVHVDVAD